MNKYIILTPQIGNMGGGQMFVCNKAEYLANLGWEVTICYFTESPVLIKKMLDFNRVYAPKIAWGINFYTPCQVKKIVNEITGQIKFSSQDEIVVESHLCFLALWGELIAEKLCAKHIINSFEEEIPSFNYNTISFFEYKLKRWECVNASEKSLRRLFKKYFKEEYNRYNHKTTFYCSNVSTDEVDTSRIILPDSSTFNIISIGRLNKPYIQTMLSELSYFTTKYKRTNIGLIFVGASPDGSVEKDIIAIFSKQDNVRIYLLGYMYPIPLNVIKCANIAISTSNAVLVTYEQGIPTIAVDASDNFAIGLYGINTVNKVFRKDEPKISIGKYIEKLFNGEIANIDSSNHQIVNEDPFIDQVRFLLKSKGDRKYYNVCNIYSYSEILISIIKRFVTSILRLKLFIR